MSPSRAASERAKPSGLESSLCTRWRCEAATSFIVPVTRRIPAIEARRSLNSRKLGMAADSGDYLRAFWKVESASCISPSSIALSSSSRTGLLAKREA